MHSVTLICLLVCCILGAYGGISDECLEAICQAATGCQSTNCTEDDEACGYYQITQPYYIDCYQPESDWKTCANDQPCAERCVQNYMDRYGRFCTGGRTPTCEDYARIHYGGLYGCRHNSTLAFWEQVQNEMP